MKNLNVVSSVNIQEIRTSKHQTYAPQTVIHALKPPSGKVRAWSAIAPTAGFSGSLVKVSDGSTSAEEGVEAMVVGGQGALPSRGMA
jgi:hypothetical protein